MFNPNVQRVVEDSVAGCDGRIRVNDHIVEVLDITITKNIMRENIIILNSILKQNILIMIQKHCRPMGSASWE